LTNTFDTALRPDKTLVLGEKAELAAVFRTLLEGEDNIVVHASDLRSNWQMTQSGFAVVEQTLQNSSMGWRHFWILYVATALEVLQGDLIPRPSHLTSLDLATEIDVVHALELTLTEPRGGLELNSWLLRFDEAASHETLLIFEGLDTGFGYTERRRMSLEGLFDAWMDIESRLSKLRFKILLHEDTWRDLNFENKSHLYERTVKC